MRHVMWTVESGKKYAGQMEAYLREGGPLRVLEYELEFKFPIGEDKPDVKLPEGLERAKFMWSLEVKKDECSVRLSDEAYYALCTFLVPRAIAYYNEPDDETRCKTLAKTLHEQAMLRHPLELLIGKEGVDIDYQGYPRVSHMQWELIKLLF